MVNKKKASAETVWGRLYLTRGRAGGQNIIKTSIKYASDAYVLRGRHLPLPIALVRSNMYLCLA